MSRPRVMRRRRSERLIFSLMSRDSVSTRSKGTREPMCASVSKPWIIATVGRLPFSARRVYSASMYCVLRAGRRREPV